MTNWYCGRDAVKRAAGIWGAERDQHVDRAIESFSRRIDSETHRRFIPRTQTRLFRWPQLQPMEATILWLDEDLISITTLQAKAQDSTPTTIAAADYFLEPNNTQPPYDRIEIDLSSTAAFESGDTPQRSISVAGSWGYSDTKRSAGTIDDAGGISATDTSLIVSDASLLDVGNTLLIQSEQLFVSNRAFAALGTILLNMVGNLGAGKATVTVTVDASHGVKAGEVIRIDSEQMYVEAVSGNDLTVVRAYNGTVLASHNDNTAIHINRTLTVERGVNGTTAATHADATAIDVYEPPFDIQELCLAETIAALAQEGAGWGRVVGAGEAAREMDGRGIADLRERVVGGYRKRRLAVV